MRRFALVCGASLKNKNAARYNPPIGAPAADLFVFPNYPNPLNDITTIEYALAHAGQVHIEIFDMMGRKITDALNEPEKIGAHSFSFVGSALNPGMYIYRVWLDDAMISRKMMVVR